jgi:hypothetical protein
MRDMTRSLALGLAIAVAASPLPAVAGARLGGSPNAAATAPPGPTNYTTTPQAAHPLGNFMYLDNGMVVPRNTNYLFTWQGRPCQTLNGVTFCQ